MKKPSIEEAHAICVQLIFSSILEEDFLPSLDDKKGISGILYSVGFF